MPNHRPSDEYSRGKVTNVLANSRARRYGEKRITVLARITRTSDEPLLTFPSGGDCIYSGVVCHDGLLWISYHSSHEGKTSIYLVKIKIDESSQ